MSILETTRYGASAKNLGRPQAPRFLAQGANFDSSAPMARGASLGKSLATIVCLSHYFFFQGSCPRHNLCYCEYMILYLKDVLYPDILRGDQ